MIPGNFSILLILYLLLSIALSYTHYYYLDDFLNAATICKLVYGQPYIDFTPWNNFLGHFIQLPAILIQPDVWLGCAAIRQEMALINTFFITIFTLWFLKLFDKSAVIFSLLSLITMGTFLSYGIEIRLDMMSAWFGFLAFILIITKRWGWAGTATAIAFLISHKAVYHVACAAVVLLFLFVITKKRKKVFFYGLRYAVPAGLITGSYYLVVSLIWNEGIKAISHHSEKLMILKSFYKTQDAIRWVNWERFFLNDYVFCSLAAFACLYSIYKYIINKRNISYKDAGNYQLLVAPVYVLTLALCCVTHTHVYMYFFVILIPPMWYMIAWIFNEFLIWFSQTNKERQLKIIGIGGFFLAFVTMIIIVRDIPHNWWLELWAIALFLIGSVVIFLTIVLGFSKGVRSLVQKKKITTSKIIAVLITLIIILGAPLSKIYEEIHQYNNDIYRANQHFGPHLIQLKEYLRSKK